MSNLSQALGEYEANEERDELITKFVQGNKDQFKKQLDSLMSEVFDQHHYWLEENAPISFAEESTARAKKLLTAVFDGDEEAAKSLFEAGDESRRVGKLWHDAGRPWSEIIHGKMHQPGAITLRQKLCELYPDLLKNERILDLESQVEAVTKQLAEANNDLSRMRGYEA